MSWNDDSWRDGYDEWKLRAPDWDQPEPECLACDDHGCPECCETEPATLDDMDMDAALEADGEKLRQLTGEDHGPWRDQKGEHSNGLDENS